MNIHRGVELPVHPIDVVSATLDDNGAIICFSGFPIADPDDPDRTYSTRCLTAFDN